MDQLNRLSGARSQMITTGERGGRSDQRTGKVVVSSESQLVSVIVNSRNLANLLITLDSENLLRCWSMVDCATHFSYKIPFK